MPCRAVGKPAPVSCPTHPTGTIFPYQSCSPCLAFLNHSLCTMVFVTVCRPLALRQVNDKQFCAAWFLCIFRVRLVKPFGTGLCSLASLMPSERRQAELQSQLTGHRTEVGANLPTWLGLLGYCLSHQLFPEVKQWSFEPLQEFSCIKW